MKQTHKHKEKPAINQLQQTYSRLTDQTTNTSDWSHLRESTSYG